MAKKILVDLNLNQNELQNAVVQNLSTAPSNPVAGQEYFNTSDNKKYIYDGTSWVDETNQGKVYTYQNGVKELTGADAGKVELDIATGANAGNVTLTADSNGLAASVDLSGKVDKNEAITGATKCKITYDAKGLVTAGADLEATDIPNLTLAKITDVTATASEVNVLDGITASTAELNILDGVTADKDEINVLDGITASTSELNIMDGVTVTASDINSVTSKIELTDLSVASSSANYLGYDNTNGEISANVDTTVTDSSTNLITSGAVATAIASAVASAVVPKASVATVSELGTLTSAHVGWMYNMSAAFTTTADFVEGAGVAYPAGSNVVIVEYATGVYKYDVFAGFVDTSSFITASSTDTLTNKTIDADDNTISDLELDNFKSGVVQTSVRAVSSASDNSVASEKAVASAIADFITASSTDTLTNKTIDADDNTISDLELDNFKSGIVVDSTTGIAAVSSASDDKAVTEKAVATALAGKTNKLVANNPLLSPVSGVATWTISNTLANADVEVKIKEVSSNDEVFASVTTSASNVVIKMNATSDIAADTYKAVIIG